MSLLHVSLSASDPQNVASFLATAMGGKHMPFPPFPDSWIAFTATDDGTAIEVYPDTHTLTQGEDQVSCDVGQSDSRPSFCHAAVGSVLSRSDIRLLADDQGWLNRICNRGPFHCVEVWVEDRILIEILDQSMYDDYRRGMTARNWAAMFGLD